MTTDIQPDGLDAVDDEDEVAVEQHPLALRWMHWLNFPLLAIMMWSGMRIYWADVRDPYAIGIGGWTWFEFWPASINETLQLEQKLAKGIAWHLNFAWFFVINGALYVLFLSLKGRWRTIIPSLEAVKDAPNVLLHDLHLRGDAPPTLSPKGYNAMQQISYSAVLVMGMLLVASGFAIYKPVQLGWLTWLLGGYGFARFIHFSMNILLLSFFVVHVLQVARAGWGNFASMVSGYRLIKRTVDEEVAK